MKLLTRFFTFSAVLMALGIHPIWAENTSTEHAPTTKEAVEENTESAVKKNTDSDKSEQQ